MMARPLPTWLPHALLLQIRLLQIVVKEVRDDLEYRLLYPVFAAMSGTGDEIPFTRDALLLQGLEQEIRLARRDDGIGCAVHEEHRGTRLADVVDGVRVIGCLLVGQDPAVTAAEDRRTVDPEASVAPAERCLA